MSFIVFVLILSVLILVHEWGHYITARKCGIRVEQFSLGFGPRLYSWTKDGCDFCLCAIPLGGFVKMAGDEREKCSGAPNEYFSRPAGERALVVLMGPVVNLILAYVCFWFVFKLGYVDMELTSQKAIPVLGKIVADSPAQKSGLQTDDRILSIDGHPIARWGDLQDQITGSTGQSVTIVFERHHTRMSVNVVPEQEDEEDIFGRHHNKRHIGVGPLPINNAKDIVIKRYGYLESFVKAGEELADITVKTYTALYQMAVGERSPKEAMGIIGMFFVIKFALTIGFSFVLHIVGIISASLAIFNLLPIIPLDGGHLALIGLEKMRGRALSQKTDYFIAKAGFTFIIVLALFVFYSDFERIGLIDKMMKLFKGTGF